MQTSNRASQLPGTLPGGGLPTYYVCSPSAPPFIPSSPLAAPPSHYPYLYANTYPQISPCLKLPIQPNPQCMSGFLAPSPMSYPIMFAWNVYTMCAILQSSTTLSHTLLSSLLHQGPLAILKFFNLTKAICSHC